ncbi:exodeoxyribonuclease V subunit alpha [Myxococcota bacterium]|nr:exodeoxyribonuclease V subunit alpha [Myxococcota bacterium]
MDTAFSRFQAEDRGEGYAFAARLLQALRAQAQSFNLDPGAVALAQEIAALPEGLSERERLTLTALVMVMLADVRQGSTRTPLREAHLTAQLRLLLDPRGRDDAGLAARIVQAIPPLLEDPRLSPILGRAEGDYRPLLLIDGWLYQQRMCFVEGQLAQRLGGRLRAGAARVEGLSAALADIAARRVAHLRPTAEQIHAVERALSQALTLIAGGPGTGKTSIIVTLLQALTRLGVEPEQIRLAAPTGKAAWRMRASIQAGLEGLIEPAEADLRLLKEMPAPQTLHRLLGYAPRADRFLHHAQHPLPAQVVIIDESSMIDVFLMARLAAAVPPDARLILLGDPDQLPSVEAGAVFRDLLDAPAAQAHAVRLTESFRMRADAEEGRALLSVARRINEGRVDLFGPGQVQRVEAPEALRQAGVELINADGPQLERFLRWWYRARIEGGAALKAARRRRWRLNGDDEDALDEIFQRTAAARLLCLTRSTEMGAVHINTRLHAYAALAERRSPETPFLPGEPVMMLHNDYDRRLFNGDQGLVLDVEGELMAVFMGEEGYRAFGLSALSASGARARLELCYAMTVHKAQGSEFEQVGVMLPILDGPLLSRELLYTAVTRARRGVILVGAPERVERAVRRRVRRDSGLAQRLG